ncbi:hypothetical protein ACOME3_007586 [Neoechinorhynchus agilis]
MSDEIQCPLVQRYVHEIQNDAFRALCCCQCCPLRATQYRKNKAGSRIRIRVKYSGDRYADLEAEILTGKDNKSTAKFHRILNRSVLPTSEIPEF